MEKTEELQKIECCLGCLCKSEEIKLHSYSVQNEALKAIFQTETISLCYICKRMAEHAETFIQNVQSNQILLENFHVITDLTLKAIKTDIHPLHNLVHIPLDVIEVGGNDNTSTEESFSVVYNSKKEVKIKLELKDEDNECFDNLDGEFFGDDNDLDSYVKEEDDYPLKLLKKELELEGINIKCLRKSTKKGKVRKKKKEKLDTKLDEIRIESLVLTREQCLEEMKRAATDKKYLDSEFKCEDCIKGFSFKGTYEKHMQKHSESNGDYECDICKQWMASEEKLNSHKRYHTQRFKCMECGLVRISRLTIKDHYRSYHCNGYRHYNCPYCSKRFNRQNSFRKHIANSHQNKEKVQCTYCNKIYSSQQSLKAHMVVCHPTEVCAGKRVKNHVCQECGRAFSSPSLLKKHSIKHSHRRDYYCVECDKRFKSDAILQHHLKTAMPHTNYLDLPLPCLHCEKRFINRRDLDRHMNRVHLNIKPFRCDQCDKAYVNSWSLNEHRRLIHEGYKRPLRFPCPMCDKIFDRKDILKGHIRTHTGERPYQCSRCPAQFSQASVLGTHVKLIHLKLTRDGRPKGGALK